MKIFSQKNGKIEKIICEILTFFAIFDCAVSQKKIAKLLGVKKLKLKNDEFRRDKNHEFLAQKNASKNIFNETLKCEKISEKLFARGKFWGKFLRFAPFVRGVAVANSVALQTARKNSDIDFLIICKNNRVFCARFFATLFLQIFGIRRRGEKISQKICLSFFIAEKKINFEKIKLSRDIYLAFWCANLRPIFGREIFERFKIENEKWVRNEAKIEIIFETKNLKSSRNFVQKIFEFFCFGFFLEKILQRILFPRMRRKKAKLDDARGAILQKNILKFHDRDRRFEFQKKFAEILEN